MSVRLKTPVEQVNQPTPDQGLKPRMLWGHPLPTWTGPGGSLAFHGEHWNNQRYTALVLWLSDCHDCLKRIVATDDAIHDRAMQEVTNADAWGQQNGKQPYSDDHFANEVADRKVRRMAVRDHLWDLARKANAEVTLIRNPHTIIKWDLLREWARKQFDLLLRMGHAGDLPLPPAGIIPTAPMTPTTDRTERLNSQPQEHENAFA